MGEGLRILHGKHAGAFLISANKIYAFQRYFNRAEMRGFEPLVGLPLRHISSVLPSTAQPHLHIKQYWKSTIELWIFP